MLGDGKIYPVVNRGSEKRSGLEPATELCTEFANHLIVDHG